MAQDVVAFRVDSEEKRALKILAAEADLSLTDFILRTLREHTDVKDRALSLAKRIRSDEQNILHGKQEPIHAS